MAEIKNNHLNRLVLPNGQVIESGETATVTAWGTLRHNDTMEAWVRADVLQVISTTPEEDATKPPPLAPDPLEEAARREAEAELDRVAKQHLEKAEAAQRIAGDAAKAEAAATLAKLGDTAANSAGDASQGAGAPPGASSGFASVIAKAKASKGKE